MNVGVSDGWCVDWPNCYPKLAEIYTTISYIKVVIVRFRQEMDRLSRLLYYLIWY